MVFTKQKFVEEVRAVMDDMLDFVMKELRNEIEAQGHNFTGAMSDTMRKEVIDIGNAIEGSIWINSYYKQVNEGVTADRIPFSPGSGAGKSKYIEALTKYMAQRLGLSEREALSAAFAVAHKHKAEGMPTRSSYRFSSNGKRLGFFTNTINDAAPMIDKGFEQIGSGIIDSFIESMEGKIGGQITIYV